MEKVKENIANLIKVKTFLTFGVLIVFVVLALRGDIAPRDALDVVTIVIAFYFGTQGEKKSAKEEKK